MSRASTAKPPALAMPSRRAAVSAGFPVRRRRPDAGDCRHQGEYAGSLSTGQAPFFHAFFLFPLLPKGRSLPKHGLRGGLFRIRTGRAGERQRPGRRPQARQALRGAMPHGAEGCRTARAAPCGVGSRMRRRARRHSPFFCGWTEKAVRRMPDGTVMAVWGGKQRTARDRPAPWLSADRAERPER